MKRQITRFAGMIVLGSLLVVSSIGCVAAKATGCPTTVAIRTRNAYGHRPRFEAYNRRIRQGHVNLIFVGDSITQRWDRQGTQVWQKYYSNRNAVDLGVDGDRTQNVLWRLDNGNIDGISPEVAVVMIGTNNHNDTAEHIGEGIIAVCQKIREKLPQTKIILLAIFPRGAKPSELREKLAKASRMASTIADGRMIYYLDIGNKFLAADGTLSKEIMPDYLHLSQKGYEIWAEAIEPTLSTLLSEN